MAPSWKQLKMSIDDRMDKYDWYIYTVEYYTTMKVNELLYHTMNKSYLQAEQKMPKTKENMVYDLFI